MADQVFVSQAGAEVLAEEAPISASLSQIGLEVMLSGDDPPTPDTISAEVISATWARVTLEAAGIGAVSRALYRDGLRLCAWPAGTTALDDETVEPGTTHTYTLVASSPGGDTPSNTVEVELPFGVRPVQPSLTELFTGTDATLVESSDYAHPDGVVGGVALFEVRRSGVVISRAETPIGTDWPWREATLSGLSGTALTAYVRHRDAGGVTSLWSDGIPIVLITGSVPVTSPGSLESVVREYKSEWPRGTYQLTLTWPSPDSGASGYYIFDAQFGDSRRVLTKGNLVQEYGFLIPGKTYAVRGWWLYQGSSGWERRFYVETEITLPPALDTPHFLYPWGGEPLKGAYTVAFGISKVQLRSGGQFELQITRDDGLSWVPVANIPNAGPAFGTQSDEWWGWNYTFNTAGHVDGPAMFRLRFVEGGEASEWRVSAPFWIDNASKVQHASRNALTLDKFFFYGTQEAEPTYWSIAGDGTGDRSAELNERAYPVLRRFVKQGRDRKGFAAWSRAGTPRSFEIMLEVQHDGTRNRWDVRGAWGGAAGYLSDTANLRATEGGTGVSPALTPYLQEYGPYYWKHDNLRYGKAVGTRRFHVEADPLRFGGFINTDPFTRTDLTDPWYTVRMRVDMLEAGARGVTARVRAQYVGPVYDRNAGWAVDTLITAPWDCGLCGITVEDIAIYAGNSFSAVNFRSFSVLPYAYGECDEPPDWVEPDPDPSATLERAWAFVLDGHVFYVLNQVDDSRSLVCDLTTGQWHVWQTADLPFWNMHRGIMWNGRVLAADLVRPTIWELDPHSWKDEEEHQIQRIVSAFQAVQGRRHYRQGSLRLTASVGSPSADEPMVRMRFSDDGGNTWSQFYEVELAEGDFEQTIEYRSLGMLRQPGRIWEFHDRGGLVRIDGADSDMETP